MRRASEVKTNIQRVINKSAFRHRVAIKQSDEVNDYTAGGTNKSESIQHAPCTLDMRYEHVGWALYACSVLAFLRGFFASEAQSHIVDARPTHSKGIIFASAAFVRRSCVSTPYWFVGGAALTLRFFCAQCNLQRKLGKYLTHINA